jgi:arsenate reductase
MTEIYGIRNCDTMKKAFGWLNTHGVAYRFHDYREQGVSEALVRGWCAKLGWDKVLNRASTTFKNLPDTDKVGLDEERAIALMVREPTMIKRPVLVSGETVTAGFKPDVYAGLFSKS